jgi:hypothetical protein
LGVRLRAVKDPDRVTPYSKPQPFITVVDRGNKIQKWDPHDGKPPAGWRPVLDGWVGAEDAWSEVL